MGLQLVTPPALEPIGLADAKTHLRVDVEDDDALICALISAARDYVERFCRRALLTQTWLLALDHFPGSHDYNQGFWDYGVLGDAALGLGIPPVGYTYEFKSEVWFRAGAIILPFSPLIGVNTFQYLDQNGILQTMTQGTSSGQYQLDAYSEPGRVAPAPNSMWPLTQISVRAPVFNAVLINYNVGYGAATAASGDNPVNGVAGGSVTLPATFPPSLIAAMKLLIGHWYENREEVLTGTRAAAIQVPTAAKTLMWANRILMQ